MNPEPIWVMHETSKIEIPQIYAHTTISKFNYPLTSHFFKHFGTFVGKREEKRKLRSETLRLKEEWGKLADAESRQKFIEECKSQVATLRKVSSFHLTHSQFF